MPWKDLEAKHEYESKHYTKEYWKKYYAEHKEARLATQKTWYETHTKEALAKAAKWAKEHPERRKQIKKNYAQKLKREVLTIYSKGDTPECNHCGITDIDVLCIDHINGGGGKHCKMIKVTEGRNLYNWLKKNNYPLGFRTLCFNCNAKRQIGEWRDKIEPQPLH